MSLLMLTVGKDTAGKHSDVAQGLAKTVRQARPRKFWLIPGVPEKSTPVTCCGKSSLPPGCTNASMESRLDV